MRGALDHCTTGLRRGAQISDRDGYQQLPPGPDPDPADATVPPELMVHLPEGSDLFDDGFGWRRMRPEKVRFDPT